MHDGRPDDGAVRRAYLAVLSITLVLVAALWATEGAREAFTRVTYPAVVIVHGALVVALWRGRLSPHLVGPWVFLSPMAILAARLVTWEFDPATRPDGLGQVVAVLAWVGVMFALAFLVFGTQRGAVVSLVSYTALYLGAGLSASPGVLAGSDETRVFVYMAGAHAARIALVWVLARNIERLSAIRAQAELLALQATTDPLTGIPNRRRLDDELRRLVAQAQRYEQPLSVVLIDLDNFKRVNDRHGHEVGDRVLVEVVERLTAAVRAADLLGRWGGEEFVLLAPQTDERAARDLAERCRSAIAHSPTRAGTVTANFGVATLGPADDARALMRRADIALYVAKSDGRDRVVGAPELTSSDYPGASSPVN
jgi:diguanylate cyclase (GGDEF)-like protein